MQIPTPFRIAGPISAISLLLLVVGIAGAWYVHILQKRTADMLDHNVSSIRAAEELELHIRELRTEINRFLLSGNETRIRSGMAMRGDIERWTAEARRCATTEAEAALMEAIEEDIESFFMELSGFDHGPLDDTAKRSLQDTTRTLLTDEILVNARKYLDINEKDLELSQADGRRMAARVVLALLLLGSSGSIAGLLAGYGLARGFRRDLVLLSFPIRDVAGKLNEVVGPISVAANPGLQDLQGVLNIVAEEVGAIVSQLQQTQREMMRADQLAATGQLAAGLAHEIRNPLMSIKLIIQAARRNPARDNSLTERDLQVLEEEVVRLESLLQTFLDFAKPATMETTRFDVRQIVSSSLQLLSRRAAMKRLTFEYHPDQEALMVDGDESQLRQVLLNLLLNALDAVPTGGKVKIELTYEGPANVVLCVSDSGTGLIADAKDRIFEPFFSTRETGLGLGLPICKRIIDAHGGTIAAEDGSLGGAAFVVRLPSADIRGSLPNNDSHEDVRSPERNIHCADAASR